MDRPDVALIAPYPSAGELHSGHGGVSSYTANLARSLSDLGLRAIVIAPHEEGRSSLEDDDGVEVRRTFDFGARALPRAARAAIATGAPVVHVQHEMFLYGRSWVAGLLPGLAILRRAGVGPVVTMHQVVDPGTVDASFVELHRVRVPPAVARAGIIGVQEAIRRLAATTIVHEASFANTLCGATVVPHGMELGSPPDREQARRRLRADSRLMVLCFGYVAPYKGLEAALEAARLARDEVNLVIAGGPHPRLAEGEEYRQELIREFGEFARFTGHVPPQDVSSWFAAADVALLPYPRPFSSSGALALALAHRTPALLSAELARAIAAPPRMATSIEPDLLAARLAGLRDVSKIEMLRCDSDVLARDREWPTVARRHLALYREVSDASGTPDRRFRAA